MTKKRVAVLISGRGSNMMALIEAARAQDYPAAIVLVVSNRSDAFGLTRAREAGVATAAVDDRPFGENREAFEHALDAKLNFDDNAEFRHPEWDSLRDEDEEDPVELEAKKAAGYFTPEAPPSASDLKAVVGRKLNEF